MERVLPRAATGTHRIRVLVVDDNAGFRESLLSLLDAGDLVVIGEASSGLQALDLVPALEPDVVLMDVRMPEMDGIEATRVLKQRHPGIGVVALSGHEDQEIVREMLVAGASGYVLKDSDGDDILNAVMLAAAGGAILSPEVTPRVIGELTEALDRERRRARELEAAQEALVERSARRQELIARLSHELRTPVTVILGVAQTLEKSRATPEQETELLARLVARARDRAPRGSPEPNGRPPRPRGARRQRAALLPRGHPDPDPRGARPPGHRGPGDRSGRRDRVAGRGADLRSAGAARAPQRPRAPGSRDGPGPCPDGGARDGRGRRPRVVGTGRVHVPLDHRARDLSSAQVKRRMCTFSSRPIATLFVRSELPPYETKGRGMPVIGMIPTVIPTLTNIWRASIDAMPAAR